MIFISISVWIMENKNTCNHLTPPSTLKSSIIPKNCNMTSRNFQGVIIGLPKANNLMMMMLPRLSLSKMSVLSFLMENGDRGLNLLIFRYHQFVEIIKLRKLEWNQRSKGNNSINLQQIISLRKKVALLQ